MTLALRYAIRSDVGLLREGNEDSAYAGPHLLAIADGMGGHAAGEVASSVAIDALTGLDADVPVDQLLDVLAAAVASANSTLHEMSLKDPSVEGMGTTLTALLWSGSTVAVCHIGDSRAYLLRDGEFHQITRDHTLVQSLVDDGRLSPAQAATHPQRSLVMRALQSGTEAEPDLSIIEALAGDRYLLCSDGLSDVVSEDTLRETLTRYTDREQAVTQLIELAIRGGGPDNITCIVADVVDSGAEPPTGQASVVVGAASNGDGRPRVGTDSPAERAQMLAHAGAPAADATGVSRVTEAPAGRRGRDGDGGRAEHRAARRRWPIVTTILILLVVVVVGGGYAAWRYTQNQYYVGTDGSQVVIYRGVNQKVLGMSLSGVYQRTGIPLAKVPGNEKSAVQNTTPVTSLADAQKTVANIRQTITCNDYVAAYNSWVAHKPKPVTKKVGKKTVTTTPPYKAAPTTPKGCTPQGTTTG
ncbi:MAG TPA: Stp1/IreP family PP2C-type Ser/Thr phosphatase [Streptosporangiaceae bacterium]|nr:Stp1/IreP family PP2C-type Ser/Thr phosphatase [Streptosporangiaceae bacterium]